MSMENTHREAEAENRLREKANDPGLTVRARYWSIYGPIVLTAVLAILGTFGGWLGNRMVNNYDTLSAKVDGIKEAVNEKNYAMQGQINSVQSQINTLAQRSSDSISTMNDRVNAVSASTRENRDAIDRLKDMLFRRPPDAH